MKLPHIILAILGLNASILANPLKIDIDIENGPTLHQQKGVSSKDDTTSGPWKYRWPVVRLPYERHQGYPSADDFYWKFENIPFAKPPLADLRFAKAEPLTPQRDDLKVPFNEGLSYRVCPQMQTGWVPKSADFLNDYFKLNIGTSWDDPILPSDYKPIEEIIRVPNQSEDCLTLDVMVPKRVFKNEKKNAPVLVWFFGGGYIFGSKTLMGPPGGLFRASSSHLVSDDSDDSSEDFIYVAINYRLGAFGWLAGTEFENAKGYENAGLSDQRAALLWVKENIALFGGDPEQVTVMGESAGASSILELFHETWSKFRDEAGANNLAELRKAKTDVLMAANEVVTYYADFGTFPFGPVVDGEYIKEPPATLLREGHYHKDIEIMVAHNSNEGALFTPPWIRDKNQLEELIRRYFRNTIGQDNMTKILNDLYKMPTGLFVSPYEKVTMAMNAMGDVGVECNDAFIMKSFPNAYRYFFNVIPGVHGQDIAYTFYPNSENTASAATYPGLALRLQRYITNFVKTGNPNHDGVADIAWTRTDPKKVYWLDALASGMKEDELQANMRPKKCDFWYGAPYAPKTSESEKLVKQGGNSAIEFDL